jgi:deoxyxylulose-5-phosphate synthase
MMDEMPHRAFDVGICEQHAVTLSAGLATQGIKVFCNIYSSFMQRAYDQVIHDVAIQKLPVVFCLDRAGLVGEDGPTHQPIEQLASFRAMPNIKVFRPADFVETFECYIEALHYDGPSILALSRQNLKQLSLSSKRQNNLCALGAYVISEAKDNKNISIFNNIFNWQNLITIHRSL